MRTMNIFIFIAISMALAISLTTFTAINGKKEVQQQKQTEPSVESYNTEKKPISSVKRVSRFLAEDKNSNAADHCHKDNDACYEEGKNGTTCCNNKCVDLKSDSKNCGACKNKCSYTRTCCNSECVDLSFDKRHCGACFKKCMTGGYCTYGMCDYA